LAAIYRRSEIFVLPARTVVDSSDPKGEGFGIVFLEAMAFEKPVVGPKYGAPAELIREGFNGLLVDPDDSGSLADALTTLLSDAESAHRMGQNGRKWAHDRFSYDVFRERLRRMLGESSFDTLDTPGRPRGTTKAARFSSSPRHSLDCERPKLSGTLRKSF
jgi:phosphatidylinositol alpha-1,6-mannosyltransferase